MFCIDALNRVETREESRTVNDAVTSTMMDSDSITSSPSNQLIAVEEALERRINRHGMVEYLVKLKDVDKHEWVPWTSLYSPQLMDARLGDKHQPPPPQQKKTAEEESSANSSSSPPSNGIFVV